MTSTTMPSACRCGLRTRSLLCWLSCKWSTVAGVERSYAYVGPADLTELVSPESVGRAVASPAEFSAWIADRSTADLEEPFTFVIDLRGTLRLAPRRSEHVACAGGQRVLGAGEIGFEKSGAGWAVGHVSNQSTGYCPDLES